MRAQNILPSLKVSKYCHLRTWQNNSARRTLVSFGWMLFRSATICSWGGIPLAVQMSAHIATCRSWRMWWIYLYSVFFRISFSLFWTTFFPQIPLGKNTCFKREFYLHGNCCFEPGGGGGGGGGGWGSGTNACLSLSELSSVILTVTCFDSKGAG